MLNVFLTVDTEIWPPAAKLHDSDLVQALDHYIYGTTKAGLFGLPYQLELLKTYGVKAVYFVEALFASAVGLDPLKKIVAMIEQGGQEAQLHVHTEWLSKINGALGILRTGQHLKDFTLDEQVLLVSTGLENLRACGVANVRAFRAGNFGANMNTLRALTRNGIRFDTSYSVSYLDAQCDLKTLGLLLQPKCIEGVYEFPVSFFRDYPGHYRHAQLCACSSQELEGALLDAWQKGWYSFVILTHSFELVTRFNIHKQATPDQIVRKRFERLLQFLAENGDKFRTMGFSDVSPEVVPVDLNSNVLQSRVYRTAWRYCQQAYGRILQNIA